MKKLLHNLCLVLMLASVSSYGHAMTETGDVKDTTSSGEQSAEKSKTMRALILKHLDEECHKNPETLVQKLQALHNEDKEISIEDFMGAFNTWVGSTLVGSITDNAIGN